MSTNANLPKHPELLVLDEPTVGVDPLLRESIWKHLVRLATEQGTTILITTHYIDEAKDSSMVGVMRDGRLLVEQDPKLLLQRFNTSSLEDVVLQLCRDDADKGQHNMIKTSNSDIYQTTNRDVESLPDSSEFIPPNDKIDTNTQIFDSIIRLKSLVHKNLVVLFRNLLLFIFSAWIPAFIILTMCIAFKDDPKYLDFGIVNHEVNYTWCLTAPQAGPGECDIENLSCKFIKSIPYDSFDLISYKTEDDARAAVHAGSIWGYIMFQDDFSSFFYERSASGASVDEDVLNKSEMIVKMDQTNKNIANKVKKDLHDAFEDYAKAILNGCGFDQRQAEFPLQYDQPIFGSDDTKFIDYVAPSVSVGWLFFFPIISSSIRYINEKQQGTYYRSLVAGTKTWEILCAYLLSEFLVLMLQSVSVFLILKLVIGVEILGSPFLILTLLLLCGICGVFFGFFIGSLCDEEIQAALMAMAFFFPNVFICGLIWPMQGMPIVLQYIAVVFPCTLSGEAMRSLFSRGWPLLHPSVYPGFLVLLGYILLFFVLTLLTQKIRNK